MQILGKVLLVDDDAISNFISGHVLRQRSVKEHVSVAGSRREALEMVAKGDFALILLDPHMNVMDGFAFLEALKRLEEGTGKAAPAVVVLASSINDLDKERAAQYPMVKGCLPKPLTVGHVKCLFRWLSEAEDKPLRPL